MQKLGHLLSSLVKTSFHFRFVLLLVLFSFFQQLSFATYTFSTSFDPSSTQLKEKHPFHSGSSLINMDIEVEGIEEDDTFGHEHPHCTLSVVYTIGDKGFSTLNTCQYLHLSKKILFRGNVPLFVLHHNWKANLS